MTAQAKLQTQIEEGLEADVFMSAATKQMKALDEEGMIASDTIVNLLENKIVLIVPAGSDSKIDSFEKIGDAASHRTGRSGECSGRTVRKRSSDQFKRMGQHSG